MGLPTWIVAITGTLLAGSALADVPWYTDAEAYNAGALGDAPNQTFHSSPIVAPVFLVNSLNTKEIDSAPYLFLDWRFDGAASPMMFRADDLSLVYAGQQYPQTKNSRVQKIRGERLLTFWEGTEETRYGNGRCLAFDKEYNLRYSVTPVGLTSGALTDLHECQETDDDTVLISIYEPVPFDLTPVGGPADGMLMDCLFQEIDPRTNKLIFEWRASEHNSLADTASTVEQNTLPAGFDFYHLNSVAKSGRNYLVGSAGFDHVTLIDGADGSAIWTLGGKQNDFEDLRGSATTFFTQHQPRFWWDENHITLFDDGPDRVNVVGCTVNCTRGLHVKLDYDAMTVETVREYFHPMGLKVLAQGGLTSLENGNVLIAWGAQPGVTEHKGDEVVMDIQLGRIRNSESVPGTPGEGGNSVYRAFKMDWRGKPAWNPSMAVEDWTVYVSWNGATELAGWLVLGSDRTNDLHGRGKILAESTRKGFETAIPLHQSRTPRYLRAAATDSKGQIIGYSPVWDCSTGKSLSVDESDG